MKTRAKMAANSDDDGNGPLHLYEVFQNCFNKITSNNLSKPGINLISYRNFYSKTNILVVVQSKLARFTNIQMIDCLEKPCCCLRALV